MTNTWKYDYASKCECSEDDKCGCSYPENMERSFIQSEENSFMNKNPINIGEQALNFIAPAVLANNTLLNDFNFFKYIADSYALLMFYRADFSAICPLEITSLNQTYTNLTNKGIKVVAVSIDTLSAHIAWKHLSFAEGGIGNVQFPLVSDVNKDICSKYGVLRSDGMAQRATFFIDKELVVRYQAVYDYKVERNFNETMRVVDKVILMDKAEHHNVNYVPNNKNKSFSTQKSMSL